MLSTALENEREKNRILQREVESLRGEVESVKQSHIRDIYKLTNLGAQIDQAHRALKKAKECLEACAGNNPDVLAPMFLAALQAIKECGVE